MPTRCTATLIRMHLRAICPSMSINSATRAVYCRLRVRDPCFCWQHLSEVSVIRRCNRHTCRNHVCLSATRRWWFSIGLESSVGIQLHHSAHPCRVRFHRDHLHSEFDLDLTLRLSTCYLADERSNVCQSIFVFVVVVVRTEALLERLFDS